MTDATWNPVRGCSRVSAGCVNCYAERVAHRFGGPGQPYEGLTVLSANGDPRWNGKISLVENHLLDPIRWQKPRMIFVNSMSDLYHEGIPVDYIAQCYAVMHVAKQHIFQVLTKRPERRLGLFMHPAFTDRVMDAVRHIEPKNKSQSPFSWPLPNVWEGVSAENQATADERIPLLLQTPAAVRWISAEPMIGPIDLNQINAHGASWDVLDRQEAADARDEGGCDGTIDWVVVGAESGPNARPFNVEWARSIVRQCKGAGVPCFVKQLGKYPMLSLRDDMVGHHPTEKASPSSNRAWERGDFGERLRLKDRKGGDMNEWPEDLRVRQLPNPKEVIA